MNEQPERVEEFKAEIAAMHTGGSSHRGEQVLLALGIAGLVGGLVLAVIGGIQVTNNTIAANQRAAMATGTFLGIAFMIGGAALFLRYSLARYLRFWLIRLIHEDRANTDRVVEALRGR